MAAVIEAEDRLVESPVRKYLSGFLLATGFLIALLGSSALLAQHAMPGMSNGEGLRVSTMPADDAVIARAPDSIMLNFESEVRLVKLALKETRQGEILIDFRYNPKAGKHFTQPLPFLAAADYYKVEWAALDRLGKLVKGSFYFSFGEDAQPPSSYMEGMDHNMQIISPDYRLL